MISGEWQRLSPWALVYLFLRGTVGIVRQNLPVLLGAGAGAAFLDAIGLREIFMLVGALLAISLLVSLLQHRRFKFRIDGDLLLVRKGIFEQSELKVRSAQIQQVLVEAPWHLRLFGLVRFSVDTPGGRPPRWNYPVFVPTWLPTLGGRWSQRTGRVDQAIGRPCRRPCTRPPPPI